MLRNRLTAALIYSCLPVTLAISVGCMMFAQAIASSVGEGLSTVIGLSVGLCAIVLYVAVVVTLEGVLERRS